MWIKLISTRQKDKLKYAISAVLAILPDIANAFEYFYYPYRKSQFWKYNNARITLFTPRRFRRESFN